MCFLRGLCTVVEAKNINNRYIFDLQWHVIAMHGNSSKEIASRCRQNNSFCQKKVSPGLLYAKFYTGKHCLVKHFAIKIKFCALRINLLFLWAADWPSSNLLGMYCLYFPVNLIDQLCLKLGAQLTVGEMNNSWNWQQVQIFFIQGSKRFL